MHSGPSQSFPLVAVYNESFPPSMVHVTSQQMTVVFSTASGPTGSGFTARYWKGVNLNYYKDYC